VVGYSKLLLERDLDPKIREKVERIAQSGERCRKIVEGVLLFSRSQQGGDRNEIDLAALVDRVVRIGEYQWKMHNVRIMREPERLPEAASLKVLADGDQLEQVLLNLLSNAVDAMPRGGTVRITLAPEPDDHVSFSVSDEGVGIPEEIRDSIFDPFFSTKEIGKGTGLGLSISYGIVRDHGGDILLESQPGRGTTFRVVLPRSGRAAKDAHRPPDPSS
jgi:signal transduction histidine kinase